MGYKGQSFIIPKTSATSVVSNCPNIPFALEDPRTRCLSVMNRIGGTWWRVFTMSSRQAFRTRQRSLVYTFNEFDLQRFQFGCEGNHAHDRYVTVQGRSEMKRANYVADPSIG